jgi:hypothetical protein
MHRFCTAVTAATIAMMMCLPEPALARRDYKAEKAAKAKAKAEAKAKIVKAANEKCALIKDAAYKAKCTAGVKSCLDRGKYGKYLESCANDSIDMNGSFSAFGVGCGDNAACKSDLAKLVADHEGKTSLKKRLVEAFKNLHSKCYEPSIIKECQALGDMVPGGTCASAPDGGPRWSRPKGIAKWINKWKAIDCKKISDFMTKHAACLVGKEKHYKADSKTVKARLGDSSASSCQVWPSKLKRCGECIESWGKWWAGMLSRATSSMTQSFEQMEKKTKEGKDWEKKKVYDHAVGSMYGAYTTALRLKEALNLAIAENKKVPKPGDISKLADAVATVDKKIAGAKKEWLRVLAKIKCPKGKNRNKGLERKLKKVASAWGKDKSMNPVYVVRMSGKKYKVTNVSTIEEKVPTFVCYKNSKATEKPMCGYSKITWDREKPIRGGRWSAWRFDGINEGSKMFCKNAKK